MKYTAESKILLEKYDELLRNYPKIDEQIFRDMVHKLLDKIPFEEVIIIKKITTLRVDPFSNTPYNGNRCLFEAERNLVSMLRSEKLIYFQVVIFTNTEESVNHGTN